MCEPPWQGQKLVGKGDDACAGSSLASGFIAHIIMVGRVGDDRVAVGAVERALAALKADKPALVIVAVRAKRPQVYVLRLEPVQAVTSKQVARKPHGFFKRLESGLQQVYFIVQGYAARLHFHEQTTGLIAPARGEKIVDFFE
jgi:hypothetical protein